MKFDIEKTVTISMTITVEGESLEHIEDKLDKGEYTELFAQEEEQKRYDHKYVNFEIYDHETGEFLEDPYPDGQDEGE